MYRAGNSNLIKMRNGLIGEGESLLKSRNIFII